MQNSKLNLFALPSQTAIIFWLIVITFVGAIVYGTSITAPFPLRWLSPVLIILSIVRFLNHPDKERYHKGLIDIEERYPLLQQFIHRCAKQVDLKRIPRILISDKLEEIYVMGSFRRWYIVFGMDQAQRLEDQLCDPDKESVVAVKVLHELFHFKTGDYLQLGWLTQLFQISFPFMLWFMAFFGGWVFVLALAAQTMMQFSPETYLNQVPTNLRPSVEQIFSIAFPSSTELEIFRSHVAEINFSALSSFVFNISLPIVIIAAFLWLFYIPLIWQMREYYADAGAVQTLGTTAPFWKLIESQDGVPNPNQDANRIVLRDRFRQLFYERLVVFHQYLFSWRRFSPDGRTEALLSPHSVFYGWKKTALFLGGLFLLLEVFIASPLALPVVGSNPMNFASVVIVVATAYFLLPNIVLGKPGWIEGLKIIAVVSLIRTIWLLLTLAVLWGLYFVNPDALVDLIRSAIYATARFVGNTSIEISPFEFLIEASKTNLIQIPIIFGIQAICTLVLIFLFSRILHWYSYFKTSQLFKRTVFMIIFGTAFVLISSVLPSITAFVTNDLAIIRQMQITVFAILSLIFVVGGIAFFIIQDQRHRDRCPKCKKETQPSNLSSGHCAFCGTALFPWLWVEYNDE